MDSSAFPSVLFLYSFCCPVNFACFGMQRHGERQPGPPIRLVTIAHPTRMSCKPGIYPRMTHNQLNPANQATTGCCPACLEVAALGELSVPRTDSPIPVGANTLESSPAQDKTSFGRKLKHFQSMQAVVKFHAARLNSH